ncbi:hypothetical protein ACQP1V_42880 (plasmid) [Microtetraspora malaysiensis]|uniref:hypothetical protein n=1 Tax=Microtetraspora malaysiensis TaxID=161358 RepID=UPI003D8AD3E0
MKIASPFTEQPVVEEVPPEEPAVEVPAEQVRPVVRRRTLRDHINAGFPGVMAAQLPSIATVRAHHREKMHVWEAVGASYGWFAVAWVSLWSAVAWLGAGRPVSGLRTLWRSGPTRVVSSQLPPLDELHPVAAVWVALWSLVAWCGIKWSRMLGILVFAALILTPILLSSSSLS